MKIPITQNDALLKALQNDFLDQPKLKVIANDILNVAYIMNFAFDRIENNIGKAENAGYQKPLSSGGHKK